jgi:hypothetical protein
MSLSGCGAAGSTAGGGTASGSDGGTAAGVYRVRVGDTLTRIATRECDDPAAAVSIFEANRGRLQRDGKALVAPDLIAVGWDLVLDCSATSGADPFSTATTNPPPVPPDPGGSFGERPVPVHEIALRAPTEPVTDGEGKCSGLGSLPVIRPWPLAAGVAYQPVDYPHGSVIWVNPTGFDGDVTVDLVDAAGRRRAFDNGQAGFTLYVDPAIAPGEYTVVAASAGQIGQGGIRVVPATRLDVIRRSTTAPVYDLVGGPDSVTVLIYRWEPGSCDDEAQPWQQSGPLALAGGVGRLRIDPAAAAPGTYCLAFGGAGGPLEQCDLTRQFRVR